jgi:hypothetical protein
MAQVINDLSHPVLLIRNPQVNDVRYLRMSYMLHN